ncbi:MAG: hypothetical protein JWR23_2592 [Mucilaginibacter sp.]|nr:hypothetical protein [Mucilaginibacter sp.]
MSLTYKTPTGKNHRDEQRGGKIHQKQTGQRKLPV